MYTRSIIGIFPIFVQYIFKISEGEAEQLGGTSPPIDETLAWLCESVVEYVLSLFVYLHILILVKLICLYSKFSTTTLIYNKQNVHKQNNQCNTTHHQLV